MNSFVPAPLPPKAVQTPVTPVAAPPVDDVSPADSFENCLEQVAADKPPRRSDTEEDAQAPSADAASAPLPAPSQPTTEANAEEPSAETQAPSTSPASPSDAGEAVPMGTTGTVPVISVTPAGISAAMATIPLPLGGNGSPPVTPDQAGSPPPTPTVPSAAETLLSAQGMPAPETNVILTTPDALPIPSAEGTGPTAESTNPAPTSVAATASSQATASMVEGESLGFASQDNSKSARDPATTESSDRPGSTEVSASPTSANQSEKVADSMPKEGKKVSLPLDLTKLVRPYFVSAEALGKAQGEGKGLESLRQALDMADIGTQSASKTDVTNLLTSPQPSLEDTATTTFGGLNGLSNLYQAQSVRSTESVRATAIVDRIHEMLRNAPIYPPRHITFQLDPPTLGKVFVEMQWAASSGWNVNWSVNHAEVRDWLAQQLPNLQQQQQNNQTPIVWHPPTLQNSSWDMSRQQSQFMERPGARDYLADEEFVPEEDPSGRPNEFWA